MNCKLTFVILMLTAISVSGYADDAPVLATAGFVRDAYNQINAKKQDKLPMASRPTSGRYNVIWDADIGQFIFESSGLQCPAGTYDLGFKQCINPMTSHIENSGDYDTSAMTWYADFEYGRVSGVASCTSDNGDYAVAYSDRNYSQTITGQYCYCKMTHPVPSAWVHNRNYGSMSSCSTYCAYLCHINVGTNTVFRGGVFGSVGQ